MWDFMHNSVPSVFVHNYEDGIARVNEGNYAFLMESTMLDYVVQVFFNVLTFWYFIYYLFYFLL